jgi:hypothetical protein
MSSAMPSRISKSVRLGRVSVLAVTIAALLAGYSTPRIGVHGASARTAVHSFRPLGQRLCFDQDGLDWGLPAPVVLPTPPVAESSDLVAAELVFPALQVKGPHYNRPPPIA